MGGMSRLTICGAVILLEASGNSEFLLPLMLVFAAARYTGNAINQPLYDLQIDMKGLPFLEGHLHNMGMLNYHSVNSIMAKNIVSLKVGLIHPKHNSILARDGRGCLESSFF